MQILYFLPQIFSIVTGLMIFFDRLPVFIENLYVYYEKSHIDQTGLLSTEATRPLIYSTCELLVGIFMFSGSRPIVNLIELKRRGRPKPQPSSSEE